MKTSFFRLFLLSLLLFSSPLSAGECIPELGNGNVCTADDFTLSEVLVNGPDSCLEGEVIPTPVTIRMGMLPTAAQRYDIGIFVGDNGSFPIGGQSCTLATLIPLENPGDPFNGTSGSGPYRDLDGNQCGDALSSDGVIYRDVVLSNVLCQDINGDGQLDIPYALTWQQQVGSCADPLDPANFFPPTSSKCINGVSNLEEVEVLPPPAEPSIDVTKDAFPTVLEAPADQTTYFVSVSNSGDVPVTLTGLNDDKFGQIEGRGTCSLTQYLDPGETYSCSFTATVSGTAGSTHTNTVTAQGSDSNNTEVSGSDSVTVTFVAPPKPGSIGDLVWNDRNADGVYTPDEPGISGASVELLKWDGAQYVTDSTTITSSGGYYSFNNLSPGDYRVLPDVTKAPLTRMVHTAGSIPHDLTLNSGQDYNIADFGFAKASIMVAKNVDKDVVPADSPQTVNYTVTVTNDGPVQVTVTALYDYPFGNLANKGCVLPQTLLPGTSYSCTFTATIRGPAGSRHEDTAIALAWDKDNNPHLGVDSAEVLFKSFPFIPPIPCATFPLYCYIITDRDTSGAQVDRLLKYSFRERTLEYLNHLGVIDVETMTLSLDGKTIYATNGGVLGTIDPSPGITDSFTPVNPAGVGSGRGDYGTVVMKDLDGLAIDPTSGVFYATERYREEDPNIMDLLIQINPSTGTIVRDAFGPGRDYVVIQTLPLGVTDADDIDIDGSGQMYGVAGNSGGGGGDHGLLIDKATGAVTLSAPLHDASGVPVQDAEGFTIYNHNHYYLTTGIEFPFLGTDNTLYKVDRQTGETTKIIRLDQQFDSFIPIDFEGISCFPVCDNK